MQYSISSHYFKGCGSLWCKQARHCLVTTRHETPNDLKALWAKAEIIRQVEYKEYDGTQFL